MSMRVLSAGSNAHGQLANLSFDDSHLFQACVFAPNNTSELPADRVITIACGANHTLLLLELEQPTGQRDDPIRQLWGCGDNRKGQLGPKAFENGLQKTRFSVFRRLDESILDAAGIDKEKHFIHTIAASWESTFIVLRQKDEKPQHSMDSVIALGCNEYGILGIGLTPKELKYSPEPHRVALTAKLYNSLPNTPLGYQVTQLAAGPHHVIATLQLFWQNEEKQVILGWGANRHGQLGVSLQPQAHSQQDKSTGIDHFMSQPFVLRLSRQSLHDMHDPVLTVALGSHHTVLLHRSGHVTGIGSNRKGQLAELRDKSSVKDIHCTWNGTYLTLGGAILSDRPGPNHSHWELRATGSCDKGQLGHSPVVSLTKSDSATVQFPFQINTHRLVDMACGSEHVLALFTRIDAPTIRGNTEVWGWGWNEHGNVGIGHTDDVLLPSLIWRPVSGDDHADRCVLAVWAGCGTSWIVETTLS